jgi:hypothetical protein
LEILFSSMLPNSAPARTITHNTHVYTELKLWRLARQSNAMQTTPRTPGKKTGDNRIESELGVQ